MTNQPGSPPVTFMDNPNAPEVYADDASGIALFNGNIRLTLESARVNHATSPGPVNRVVMARLVIPIVGAERLRDLLVQYLAQIKSAPDTPPSSRTLQ